MKVRTLAKNDYPTSDGRPVAETELHFDLLTELILILRARYADVPEVHVGGNMLLFYAEGDRRRHVSPDVQVTFGVGKERRDNFLLWEEAPPAVVIELTSSSTHREDTGRKMDLYRDTIGVAEYILFDPTEDYLVPPLQGFRLTNGDYRPIRLQRGRLRSRQLNLWLERDGNWLYFVDPVTGKRLQRPEVTERERAGALADERDAAVDERDAERQRAEAERERAEAERERAEAIADERNAAIAEREALAAALQAAQQELAALRNAPK